MGVYFGATEITGIHFGEQEITEIFFGNTEIFSVWDEYDGTLPAQYSANGSMLADYRIYGSAGGVGDYVAPEYKQVHTDTVMIDGIVWDILGYDHDTVYKSDNTLAQHSVTIQAHDVLMDMQFGAKEALFAFDNGLSAGTYHFTVGSQPWYSGDVNKTIQFTLASAIPAGGQLVINNAYNATMIGSTISSYASGTATTATETVTMSEGGDGADLGTVTNGLSQDGVINSIQCAFHGYNNWQISAIRQYLNSSASAGSVWFPQTKWDRPPSWAANTAGFLNGLSANFMANLGTTSKTTALNNVTDGGGTGTTLDKVFLISRSEVYAGDEVTGGEGEAYQYYSDFSDLSAPGMGVDSNRIKALNGTAKSWWMRSSYKDVAYSVRSGYQTGAVFNSNAAYGFGVAPACCIPLDDIETNDWLREKFLKNPSTAYGYEVDMSVSDGTTSTTTPIYIGDTPLGEGEYVDYGEGKIYRISKDTVFTNGEATLAANTSTSVIISQSSDWSKTYPAQGLYRIRFQIETSATSAERNTLVLYLDDGTTIYESSATNHNLTNGWYNWDLNLNKDNVNVYVLRYWVVNSNAEIKVKNVSMEKILSGGYVDPPVPLPQLPTVNGTNIVDYAGQSAAVPSRFTAKYRKEGF